MKRITPFLCLFALIRCVSPGAPAPMCPGAESPAAGDLRAVVRERVLEARRRCPAVTVQDVYKMFYQAVFGVRHLLQDRRGARKYLQSEYDAVAAADRPLLEPLSADGEVVRIDLEACKFRGLDLDRLFLAMTESAEAIGGTAQEFAAYWRAFTELIERGDLPYSPAEAREWGQRVPDDERPVHHSAAVEESCRPHYRVVKRSILYRVFPALSPNT